MSTEVTKQKANQPTQTKVVRYLRPYYEVRESDDAYRVDVYMPGVNRESAQISLTGRDLSIEGHSGLDHPADWRPIRREIPEGHYRLTLQLNVAVDANRIKAESKDGVLRLTLPVAEEAMPRTIPVE